MRGKGEVKRDEGERERAAGSKIREEKGKEKYKIMVTLGSMWIKRR